MKSDKEMLQDEFYNNFKKIANMILSLLHDETLKKETLPCKNTIYKWNIDFSYDYIKGPTIHSMNEIEYTLNNWSNVKKKHFHLTFKIIEI